MASSIASLTSGFFPSNNHDRLYTSDQLAYLFSALVSDGAIQNSSGDPDTVPFKVALNSSDSTAVSIGKGLAWLKNTWTRNAGTASLSMTDTVAVDVQNPTRRTVSSAANNSNPRWDAIAIEVNKSVNTRANSFVVVEGVPSGNPARPDVSSCNNESEERYYYAIAYVYRPAGSGYTIYPQTSDKLILAIAQNGGIPYVTSLVSEATSIGDLLTRWNDEVENALEELHNKISAEGAVQLMDGAVTTVKLASNAVTTAKVANGAITKPKMAFSVAELDASGKILADSASSGIVSVTGNVTLGLNNSGKTMMANSGTPVTLTLPSTVGWAAGTEMEIVKWGTGSVTVAASGNTKLFSASNGESASVTVASQYGTIVLKMMATNQWVVAGDI